MAGSNLPLTRTRSCHQAGGELKQIQFLLGHVSVHTDVSKCHLLYNRFELQVP
jgi:hypothetical protein